MTQPRLLRITTVPISLKLLLRGQPQFFTEKGFTVLTVSADGKEVAELKSEGIAHQVVPMTRQITPIQDLKCIWQLIKIIKSFKPDIIHTHTPKAGLLGMLAAWLCGVKVRMHTVAGLPVMESKGTKRIILKLTERLTYWCATRVYPNSTGLLQFMKDELGATNTNKFTIIGKGSSNGIDTTVFQRTPELEEIAIGIRTKYQIHADEIVFSFVGRIVRDKGIGELVNAFQHLQAAQPSTRMRLLLVGPFEQELDPVDASTYQYLQTSEQVILAGFQADVRPWLMASDVFVFPSYREGFPNVVMQACCLEVPCIVSNINGCNEIIQDQITGLIVPPKTVKQLQDAMQELSADYDRRRMLGQAGRDFVRSYFDQQYVWAQLYAEYRTLS